MALSFSDLSVWCYTCDNYIDNEKLYPIKNAAHKDKFGYEMLKVETNEETLDLKMIWMNVCRLIASLYPEKI